MNQRPAALSSPGVTFDRLRKLVQRSYPAYDVEIREGEYVVVAPHDLVSSNVVSRLVILIGAWVQEHGLGNVFESNGGFQFADGDMLAPDLTYVSLARLPVIPRSFARVIPELVVEIRSSRQTERATRRKLESLLAKGVDVGVYVDPGKRVVEIHRTGAPPVTIGPGRRFELPDVLPGFGFVVDELWPR